MTQEYAILFMILIIISIGLSIVVPICYFKAGKENDDGALFLGIIFEIIMIVLITLTSKVFFNSFGA